MVFRILIYNENAFRIIAYLQTTHLSDESKNIAVPQANEQLHCAAAR